LPYEKSTLYSFFVLLLILKSFRVDFSKYDYWFTAAYVCGHAVDPFIIAKEVSLFKIWMRFCWLCCSLFFALYSESTIIQLCFMYISGYLTASIAVQAYSLYTAQIHKACALTSNNWCAEWDEWVDAVFLSVKSQFEK
jgi:hypothetical protein